MFWLLVAALQEQELLLMRLHEATKLLLLRRPILPAVRVVSQPSWCMVAFATCLTSILAWFTKLWLNVAFCCKTPLSLYILWPSCYRSIREIVILLVCPLPLLVALA